METLKIGDFTLTWLNGGVTHLDGGAMFGVVPRALWSKKYPYNEQNQIELRTDPILIQTNGKNIVVEAGIGNNKMSDKQRRNYGVTEESKIQQSLNQLGLSTTDIDYVLMTHMHFDHACGLTSWESDQLVPTFPRAKIYTQQIEWIEMRSPNIRSKNTYWRENWEAIEEMVETFQTDIEIVPGLTMVHTGGHSQGHSIIMIESGNETLIHLADLMPTHAHKHVLWVMAYDDYPMRSIEMKQKFMNLMQKKQAWFSFYHDAIYRAVKFDQHGDISEHLKRN
ncbi:YtnP family quorum-quenching lactonase [Litchfieldia salsa]|uniref:Glyoxylase, beta-lactamase superfamily II n=1 Tax=Litchfieldia salsa TaxID=930152 RepID=A0A1H0P8H4_9BACI|nr:MBL fold metallo-hydrolase [Litchfieldia salsa]SDP00936.1 Glyoxylase, beta-lactamase superfamily II [Litchfieldia salsa]